jgi:glycosyltransferase involved in cell wall biosynthesis
MYKYSIILSTYNWPEALDLTLCNLVLQLQLHKDVEIIIADDGSSAITKEIVDKYVDQYPLQIQHIWHEDTGFRKAIILNKAVMASSGEYLLFLDGDCISFPDYITMHKQLAETGFFVAGNRVLLSQKFTKQVLSHPHIISSIFKWNIFNWLQAKLLKKVNKLLPFLRLSPHTKWRYLQSNNWRYPKGCNFGVWRADFFAINGFDASFTGWGHEDADLFVRLLHNQVKIKNGRFALPVLHLWHKESSRANDSKNYQVVLKRLTNPTFILAKSGLNGYLK